MATSNLTWRYLAAATALLALLLALSEAGRTASTRSLSLPIDNRTTELLIQGVYGDEQDTRGIFRWTTGSTSITIPGLSGGQSSAIELLIGPPAGGQATAQLGLGAQAALPLQLDPRGRRYRLLVDRAAAARGTLTLWLHSPTSAVESDPRQLGLRLEGVRLQTFPSGALAWPPRDLLLAQLGLLLAVALIIGGLGLPPPGALAALLLSTLAIGLISQRFPLLAAIYSERLMLAAGLLGLGTLVLLPLAERRLARWLPPGLARALWGATLLAVTLRLSGALFPTFRAFDLSLNLGRLVEAIGGTMVMTNESFEFGGGVTVYPPGPYLVLMPFLLLGIAPGLLIQAGIGLIDGLGAFAVGLLAHYLGLGRRSAVIAALLYATVPVGLTTLYYGHTAQAFGQALMAPLAVALLIALRQPQARAPWVAACTLLSMALLSHIGVSVLAVAWLGLFWLSQLMPAQRSAPAAGRLTLVLIIGGAIGFLFAYAPVVLLHIQELASVGEGVASDAIQPSYNLIGRAWLLAFQPLGLLAALGGLLLLPFARLPQASQALIGSWLGAALLFCAVELLTGLQVRYFVFLVPLVCVFAAHLLAQLAAQRTLGRWGALALLGLISLQGGLLWYNAFSGAEPLSMITILR